VTRLPVDIPHLLNLPRFFLLVVLIDTEWIEPPERKVQVIHRRQMLGLGKPLASYDKPRHTISQGVPGAER